MLGEDRLIRALWHHEHRHAGQQRLEHAVGPGVGDKRRRALEHGELRDVGSDQDAGGGTRSPRSAAPTAITPLSALPASASNTALKMSPRSLYSRIEPSEA